MTENTMADLRRECAKRLRRTLHGREIDMLEESIETAHMLGIVPIGTITTPEVEKGTLLDPKHEFWEKFQEDVNTKSGVIQHVESAIRSLQKDGIFRMTHPYGEEADIVYCEVDKMDGAGDVLLPTECAECNNTIDVPLSLNYDEEYTLDFTIECPHCDFEKRLVASPRQ